jgi:CRP-like cAMP-binding protein
VTEKRKTK